MHRSVFVNLLAIMATLAVCILLLVGGFLWFIVAPSIHGGMDQVLQEYALTLARTGPDRATAAALGTKLNVQVRYESPAGGWATADNLPTVGEIRAQAEDHSSGTFGLQRYYVATAPDGGTYLFVWSLRHRIASLHPALVVLMLLILLTVLAIAYLVLRQLIRPLRTLTGGVVQLSSGRLDIALPVETDDEFGRLTIAFNAMVGRIRGMLAARDQLLQDVSHELRSPITRMRVALELMPESDRRNALAEDLAEMERLITGLLELERLQHGRGLTTTRADLGTLLRTFVGEEHTPPQSVQLNLPAGPLPVQIDAGKVRAVFRNLLENAAKYAPAESGPVVIEAHVEPHTIVVRVTDRGPGIPVEERDRVFEPFFRVDRSRSKDTGGYGLGLSICKRVMQAHGGDIVLETTAQAGASFRLTLPKAE
jgi:signal transduction histidine kinase